VGEGVEAGGYCVDAGEGEGQLWNDLGGKDQRKEEKA